MVLKLYKKIWRILSSTSSPRAIALGVVFGIFTGLSPLGTFHNIIIMLLALFLNTSLPAMALSTFLFKLVSVLLSAPMHYFGLAVLTGLPVLYPFWTNLYSMPLLPYTNFNSTLVMGSFLSSLLLSIPFFILTKRGVKVFREKYMEKYEKTWVYRLLKGFNPFTKLETVVFKD